MNSLFKPRRIQYHDKTILLSQGGKPQYAVVVPADADDWALAAAGIVCRAIGLPESCVLRPGDAFQPAIALRIANLDSDEGGLQAFTIDAATKGITLTSPSSHGLVNAARALEDLVYQDAGNLLMPEVTLYDYPDLPWRGIYVECRWGPDSMSLDEWKHAVDTLASLRMNVMSIGIYNNWPIQYDGKISEWMMVPIRKYPKLKTPKLVDYYSPSQKKDVHLEYVPRIYEEDLFGEIIRYAKSRGVLVRPHFNTPGHNTQIPRHYPETSAKFADGTPKKYGFCMSSPATFEVMFGIFDEICDRYLLPNGIDWFHIGLDEVYPLVGMNEDMPLKKIDPWCECPECSKTSPEDRFVNYAVRLAKHLKDKGINNIGMWHDHFARGGRMNQELSRRFEEEGLKDNVILHWWRYSDFFDTTMPELGFRRWVVPMTGYFYWINYQNHLKNCFLAAEKGVEENAEGTEAYGLWHPSYHQHFAILAAKSWNSGVWPDVASFRHEYAKLLFGERWREGLKAFEYFDEVTAGPGMMNFVSKLFAYPYLYAGWKEDAFIRENYPRPIIEQLVTNSLNVTGFISSVTPFVQKALDIFSREDLWHQTPSSLPRTIPFRELYIAECMRMKAVMDLFPRLANAVKAVRAGVEASRLCEWADSIDAAIEYLDSAMLAIEETWNPAFVPQALRELTLIRRFACELSAELRTAPSGDLKCMECKPIDWPND